MKSFAHQAGRGIVLSALSIAGLTATTGSSHASETMFAYTYLAETLPANALELEHWTTLRSKTSQGTYNLWQNRTELEYGLADHWTVSLYLNSYSVTAQNNNATASRSNYAAVGDGDEVSGGGPVTFGSYVPNLDKLAIPSARYHKTDFESVSVESIYQLLSPYKDALGLAAYVEWTHGPRTSELELKAIFQKNLLDDQLVLAANLAVELEDENWSQMGNEKESKIELSGGASYRFAPGWRAGLEARNERGYKGHSFGKDSRDYSAWFAGPNISYAAERWFVTVGYLEQLPLASAYSDAAKVEMVDNRVYKATEKVNFRVKLGYNF